MSSLMSRLPKLLALARASDSPESATAEKLLHKLLAKHGLSAADVVHAQRTRHVVKVKDGTREIAAAVAAFLDIGLWSNPVGPPREGTRRRTEFWLVASDDEAEVWQALYAHSCGLVANRRRQHARERRELKREHERLLAELSERHKRDLRSYTMGHLKAAYPLDTVTCPECAEGTMRRDAETSSWVCDRCGLRKPERAVEVDREAYIEGARHSRRPVAARPTLGQIAPLFARRKVPGRVDVDLDGNAI